ncbi:hypothetical protein ACFRCW_41375 [Streptomyces sp. NPDC056653]|uniref:hypothetical protein n=1 Tax=Streptomyces sp. NPDC056653 TaxID=3345894 RepID=UPI0036CAD6A1
MDRDERWATVYVTALAVHPGEAVPPPASESIYAGLAVRWTAAGRVVPGQTDQEWNMLTSRCPWPNR